MIRLSWNPGIFVLLLLTTSCSVFQPADPELEWRKNEREFRKELDMRYAARMSRDEIHMHLGEPNRTDWVTPESDRDPYLHRAIGDIEEELVKKPARYDLYWIRHGFSSVWGDYVFYDRNDRVIRAYRRDQE